MVNKNIKYKSKQIIALFSGRRRKWDELYPSEKWVFERIYGADSKIGDVLDVGCACAGLGSALNERFILNSYTGVDINEDAVNWAIRERKLNIPTSFISGDILEIKLNSDYDLVVSLSCADWNIETDKIINACWDKVRPGGHFVISLRLTTEKGVNDINMSYQHINPATKDEGSEVANYAVFNFNEAIAMIKKFIPAPEKIGAYGYWGLPSPTAVTPFDRLVFAVFYIKKGVGFLNNKTISCEFSLPIDIF